jgi:hypothetical protein
MFPDFSTASDTKEPHAQKTAVPESLLVHAVARAVPSKFQVACAFHCLDCPTDDYVALDVSN